MINTVKSWVLPRHRWMKRVQDTFTNEGERVGFRKLEDDQHLFGWVASKAGVSNYYRIRFSMDGVPLQAEVSDFNTGAGKTNILYRRNGVDFGKPPWEVSND